MGKTEKKSIFGSEVGKVRFEMLLDVIDKRDYVNKGESWGQRFKKKIRSYECINGIESHGSA